MDGEVQPVLISAPALELEQNEEHLCKGEKPSVAALELAKLRSTGSSLPLPHLLPHQNTSLYSPSSLGHPAVM